MKVIKSVMLVLLLVLISCENPLRVDLTGPSELPIVENLNQSMKIVLNNLASVLEDVKLKSNMFIDSDSSGTEYREVQFSDSLEIVTIVSEGDRYKLWLSSGGVNLLSAATLNGHILTNWVVNENQGLYAVFDVSLNGNVIQSVDNLADTVVVPIKVYAPLGSSYSFNGTSTDFDNRIIPENVDSSLYYVDMVTMPGTHKFDFWGSGIDSVQVGNVTIYDVSGGYIRFEIIDATHVTLLDSLSGSYNVSWVDSASADTVNLMLSDQLGDRSYLLVPNAGTWNRNIVMPSDTLIHLRVEADGDAQFTNVEVLGTELHHLVETNPGEYWFVFRIINGEIIQEENNVTIILNINS